MISCPKPACNEHRRNRPTGDRRYAAVGEHRPKFRPGQGAEFHDRFIEHGVGLPGGKAVLEGKHAEQVKLAFRKTNLS